MMKIKYFLFLIKQQILLFFYFYVAKRFSKHVSTYLGIIMLYDNECQFNNCVTFVNKNNIGSTIQSIDYYIGSWQ